MNLSGFVALISSKNFLVVIYLAGGDILIGYKTDVRDSNKCQMQVKMAKLDKRHRSNVFTLKPDCIGFLTGDPPPKDQSQSVMGRW